MLRRKRGNGFSTWMCEEKGMEHLHTVYLFLHRLRLVDPRVHPHVGSDPNTPHLVHLGDCSLDSRHHSVEWTLHIRAICVKLRAYALVTADHLFHLDGGDHSQNWLGRPTPPTYWHREDPTSGSGSDQRCKKGMSWILVEVPGGSFAEHCSAGVDGGRQEQMLTSVSKYCGGGY